MNLVRSFMGYGPKQEVATIALGQFNLLRSQESPKSSLECIYSEATLTIVEVARYTYDIAVYKLEEYNDDGDIGESEEFGDDAMSVLSVQSRKKDEQWTFKLSENLGFHKAWNKQGSPIFVWNNINGSEENERVQFAISPDTFLDEIESFTELFYRLAFTSKFRRSPDSVTSDDILQMRKISVDCYTGEKDDIEDFCPIIQLAENTEENIQPFNVELDHQEVFYDAAETPILDVLQI